MNTNVHITVHGDDSKHPSSAGFTDFWIKSCIGFGAVAHCKPAHVVQSKKKRQRYLYDSTKGLCLLSF